MKKKVNWTQEQVDLLTKMAYDGAKNADIAKAVDKTVEDVHHKRSHLGLTIAKIEAAKAAKKPVKKAPAAKAAPATKKMAKAAAEAAAAVDKPAKKSKEKPCEYTYSISMTKPQILNTLQHCIGRYKGDKCKGCALNDMDSCHRVLMTLAAQAIEGDA